MAGLGFRDWGLGFRVESFFLGMEVETRVATMTTDAGIAGDSFEYGCGRPRGTPFSARSITFLSRSRYLQLHSFLSLDPLTNLQTTNGQHLSTSPGEGSLLGRGMGRRSPAQHVVSDEILDGAHRGRSIRVAVERINAVVAVPCFRDASVTGHKQGGRGEETGHHPCIGCASVGPSSYGSVPHQARRSPHRTWLRVEV
jgi:hypothetical protein